MRRLTWLKQFLFAVLVLSFSWTASPYLVAQTSNVVGETIVMIRHGEKTPAGFSQLTCQGLNRTPA